MELDRSYPALINGNTFVSNTAISGGGVFLQTSEAVLINNIVAGNSSLNHGSGIRFQDSSPRLVHTTFAGNKGPSGVMATQESTLAMTNTIVVSHTVGVRVASNATAILRATLWGTGTWSNEADWSGPGTIRIGSANFWGDPAFVDADGGDCCITPRSSAVDRGITSKVGTDIEGSPQVAPPDLGADEAWLNCIHLPLVMRNP